MASIIVLVGVAGSGKSTWANKEVAKDFDFHSSDDIREEIFGELSQEDNTKVFEIMRERAFASLESGKNVVYDATNLSRKRRTAFYNQVRALKGTHSVGIAYFSRSLKYLLDVNENREEHKKVPVDKIKEMYINQQIPREGTDCDAFVLIGDSFFDANVFNHDYKRLEDLFPHVIDQNILEEITLNYKTPHDSPYHLESIDEHINMCIEASNTKGMKIISLFHDLGKGVTKNGGRYQGHENVGANYIFNALWHSNAKDFDKAEIILQHMNAHSYRGQAPGLSDRLIRRYNLSDSVVRLTNYFSKNIDSPSRITEKEE